MTTYQKSFTRALVIGAVLSPLLFSGNAFAAGCTGASDAAHCQYRVDAGSPNAPAVSVTGGVRQDNGMSSVLYDRTAEYNICRFIDNSSGHDLFVPQGSRADFSAFINNRPNNVGWTFCVKPKTVTASPTWTHGNFELFTTTDNPDSPNFVNVDGSVPAPGSYSVQVATTGSTAAGGKILRYDQTPTTTTMQVNNAADNVPLIFTSTRHDCIQGTKSGAVACNIYSITETQTLTSNLTSSGSGDTLQYNWDGPAVQTSYARQGVPISSPTDGYSRPPYCPPGYVPGDNWTVGGSYPVGCPGGYVGTYTQNYYTPYTCVDVGSSAYGNAGGNVLTSNDSSSQCLPIINGACGSDNGAALTTSPTNLCSSGSPSGVDGSGPWNWSCAGANTGSSQSCSAGVAGPACWYGGRTAPGMGCPTSQCFVQLFSSADEWSSIGTTPGGSSIMFGAGTANINSLFAAAGASHDDQMQNIAIGPQTRVTISGSGYSMNRQLGPFFWHNTSGSSSSWFAGTFLDTGIPTSSIFRNNGPSAGHSGMNPWFGATITVQCGTDGVCGSANGGFTDSPPTSGLCSVGTASGVSADGNGLPYWNCAGINGGNPAYCHSYINGQCSYTYQTSSDDGWQTCWYDECGNNVGCYNDYNDNY